MRRTPAIGLSLCLVLFCGIGQSRQAMAAERPNVILVMTDDQGYGDLGCHGNEIIQTPNLDAMYAESVRMTRFHVDPTCSPTRAALMTGRYAVRTGVWHTIMGRSILRKSERTMAEVFAAAGYRTAMFGKWHLGDNYPFRPQDRGFQHTIAHGGGGVGQTPDYFGNDYFDDTYFVDGRPQAFEGYCTDVFFDGALKFIEQNRERPFFVYLPTNAAHGPYNVAKKYSDLYAGKPGVPNANFWGMVTNIDENMGRLRRRLQELELTENTILIFMTDNGTAAGFRGGRGFNAGMKGAKGSEYEGGHRVPMFVHWPAGGMNKGRDIGAIAAHVDLLPTLADLCDVDVPQSPALDGVSLAPLWRDHKIDWPARTLVVDSQRIEHPQKWRKSCVMDDRWRLINGKELYDIKADPGQKKNVASAHPEVVARLRAEYESWWSSVSENFDQYARISIPSAGKHPRALTAHDWHEANPPWHQGHIQQGAAANGFWTVDVKRAGPYEIELRRWPREVDAAMNAAGPGKAVSVTQARLKIGEVDVNQPVAKDDHAVRFTVELSAGPARLETWLTGDGKPRGAYYVYIRPADDATK